MIVKNIEKNKNKLFEMDELYDFLIQPSNQCINLKLWILFYTLMKNLIRSGSKI